MNRSYCKQWRACASRRLHQTTKRVRVTLFCCLMENDGVEPTSAKRVRIRVYDEADTRKTAVKDAAGAVLTVEDP